MDMGKSYLETSPLPWAAVQMDLSIVFCGNPCGKTEAEPRTTLMLTPVSLNPVKPFEDSSLLIERYPDARVL
jgi:hypothetical protein